MATAAVGAQAQSFQAPRLASSLGATKPAVYIHVRCISLEAVEKNLFARVAQYGAYLRTRRIVKAEAAQIDMALTGLLLHGRRILKPDAQARLVEAIQGLFKFLKPKAQAPLAPLKLQRQVRRSSSTPSFKDLLAAAPSVARVAKPLDKVTVLKKEHKRSPSLPPAARTVLPFRGPLRVVPPAKQVSGGLKKSPSTPQLGVNTKAGTLRANFNVASIKARETRLAKSVPLQSRTLNASRIFLTKTVQALAAELAVKYFPAPPSKVALYTHYSRVLKSPTASKLLELAKAGAAANRGYALSLQFVDKVRAPFGGTYNFTASIVSICEDLKPIDQFRALLFELANAVHTQRFLDIDEKVGKKQITKGEDFALAVERVECDSAKIYTEFVRKCIKEEGWEPELDVYGKWKNFGEYLQTQRTTGHFQHYVINFQSQSTKTT